MSDPILTIRDVADYLKVNERTIYRLASSGELPGFKVGSSKASWSNTSLLNTIEPVNRINLKIAKDLA